MNPPAYDSLPSALARFDEIASRARGRGLALFLDYDGTLSPIADRPELAVFPETVREAVARLARFATVAVVSGRDLDNVKRQVGLGGIYYAGSHGFEMEGPDGSRLDDDPGARFLPALDAAERSLRAALADIDGALIERKRFSVAVHYRLVEDLHLPAIERAVAVVAGSTGLRRMGGKRVHEIQPSIEWHKGKAILRLLQIIGGEPLAVYVGDDVTDEHAFEALRGVGIGIVVYDEPRPTAATYHLRGTAEVERFLQRLAG